MLKRKQIIELLKTAKQRNPKIKKCIKCFGTFTKPQLQAILEHPMVLETLEPEVTQMGGSLFGKLRQGFNRVVDGAKNFFGVDTKNFNTTSQQTLKEYGSRTILEAKVARTPLSSALNRLLNVLSLGATKKAKNELKYHSFYHLAIVVKLRGVTNPVVVEKNEAVNVDQTFPVNNLTQFMNVNLQGKQITLDQLVQQTLKTIGNNRFFLYRAFNDRPDGGNCQRFVADVLRSNGLITTQLDQFINQNIEQASATIPQLFKRIANVATDAGAFANRVIGRGDNPY